VNKSLIINIALGTGLTAFTFIVFKLDTGAFTIVMAVAAAIVFALILMSADEKEQD